MKGKGGDTPSISVFFPAHNDAGGDRSARREHAQNCCLTDGRRRGGVTDNAGYCDARVVSQGTYGQLGQDRPVLRLQLSSAAGAG